MRFSKKILKLWTAIVFWIFILEQNVFGFVCRTICRESITLNRILKTLKHEIFEKILKTLEGHSFSNFDLRTKWVKTYM